MTFTVYTPTKRRIARCNEIPSVLPPLVCLSDIARSAAPFEGGCGIYFLQRSTPDGQQIVYVGQSVNVYARVATHALEEKKIFDSWSWVECHRTQLDLLESLYIHWIRPSEQGRQFVIGKPTEEMAAPIARQHLQHLLDGLAPTSAWRKRSRRRVA